MSKEAIQEELKLGSDASILKLLVLYSNFLSI